MDYAGLKKNNNNITLTMSKEKAQIGVKIAKKAERKQCLQFCIVKEQLACVFFYPAGLDADRGSALGPRGNRSLHTPSTFFQQEKYCPLKQKYTVTKKQKKN